MQKERFEIEFEEIDQDLVKKRIFNFYSECDCVSFCSYACEAMDCVVNCVCAPMPCEVCGQCDCIA